MHDITQLKQEPGVAWSPQYTAIYGNYAWLNDAKIHYLMTSISIRDLHREVRIMEEIPGVEKWGFESLFQRVINRKRVDDELVRGYLRNPEKIKFFPPLTIAILPAANNSPKRTYDKPVLLSKAPGRGSLLSTEGLEIAMPFQDDQQALQASQPVQFKWDQSKFVAVAIDGQHRITALRRFVSEQDQTASVKDVPVIFLAFESGNFLGRDILQATRELFVDVNSKPKTVDTSRLILLDDRDVPACLARRVISPAFNADGTIIAYAPKRLMPAGVLEVFDAIPQELVNVTADKSSADVTKLPPWQFTSAFIIHRMIRSFFIKNELKELEEFAGTADFTAEPTEDDPLRDIKKEIIARREYEDDSDEDDNESIFIDTQDIFSFSPSTTNWISDRVMQAWGPVLRSAFTGFKPYHTMISRLVAREAQLKLDDERSLFRQVLISEGSKAMLEGDSDAYDFKTPTWASIESDNDRQAKDDIKDAVKMLRRDLCADERDVVWLSVFQRGVLFDVRATLRAVDSDGGMSRESFADFYFTRLNAFYDNGWFAREFAVDSETIWAGILLKFNPEGEPVVDASDGAARRLGLFLRLLVIASGTEAWDESNESKKGIKSAFTQLTKSIAKYMKAKSPDSTQDFALESRSRLRRILGSARNIMGPIV